MEEVNLCSPREIRNILDQFCLHPHKKWGQNFLVDGNIVNKILHEVDITEKDFIIEVGPGLGALTLPLVKKCAFVIAIEIDRGLVSFLKELLNSYENKLIIEGDVRKVDLPSIGKQTWRERDYLVKLVANLPYYITSPFIYSLIGGEIYWNKAIIMVQKELALRLQAPVGSPLYGTLSVLCQQFTHSRIAFGVSPNVFYPSPRVESAVVVLEPRDKQPDYGDKDFFIKFISGIFRHRRKTLLNSLSNNFEWDKSFINKLLNEAKIDPGIRPESLSAAQFANLCRLFYNN